MIILTSPAKTLDYESAYTSFYKTNPLFLDKSVQIIATLKEHSVKKLKKVLHVSQMLAELNYERFQQWQQVHTDKNSRPALFAYHGDIYRQLFPATYNRQQAEYAQHSLRIISGLYGLIRPYDLMQPYRLEMNAVFKIGSKKDLYTYWGTTLTEELNIESIKGNHNYIINLASREYSKVIHTKKLNIPIITIEFRQTVKGKLVNYGLFDKKARGMMIEYLIKNRIDSLEKIKEFNIDGYSFKKQDAKSIWFVKS